MAEREEEADADRALALLHQLAGDIVDGGDVIGVDRVAQAEAVGQQRRAQQHRMVVKGQERPEPGDHIGRDQESVESEDAAPETGCLVVEEGEEGIHHSSLSI